MILGVSVGRDPTFTKDMFGSRLKSGLYLDRIQTYLGEKLVLGPDPASRIDPGRTGGRVLLSVRIRTMATVPIGNSEPNQASILAGLLSWQG